MHPPQRATHHSMPATTGRAVGPRAQPDAFHFDSPARKTSSPIGHRLQRVSRAEELLPSEAFLRALAREAGRSERTGDPFTVIRLDKRKASEEDFEAVRSFCAKRLRITDEAGWIEDKRSVGILLPGTKLEEGRIVARALFETLDDRSDRFQCTLYSDESGKGEEMDAPTPADQWMGESKTLTQLFLIPMTWGKRALDLVGGLILGLFALPILLVSAIAIRLEGRGPIVFKQTRVGHGGKEFTLYKLRTMVVDAEAKLKQLQDENERDGPAFKINNDPRVTRVGKLLRKTCIDELPQIWNVLKGDMTLVGPRPAMPHEVAEYEAWHHSRLLCKGGLTCLWQVDGKAKNVSFQDWVRMDIRYQSQASPLQDLRLLARTAWVVLSSRGDS